MATQQYTCENMSCGFCPFKSLLLAEIMKNIRLVIKIYICDAVIFTVFRVVITLVSDLSEDLNVLEQSNVFNDVEE